MRQLDSDGFLMCKIQGRIFEKSVDVLDCSSPIFIKNYMLGDIARSMDILAFLNTTISDERILDDMKDISYGTTKYTSEEMYFIGHFYRYVSYIYEIDSKKIFKMIPGRILKRYAFVGTTIGDDKALHEIINDYHIDLNSKDKLFEKTKSTISKNIENYIFKAN